MYEFNISFFDDKKIVSKFFKSSRLFEESPSEFDKTARRNSNYLQILFMCKNRGQDFLIIISLNFTINYKR